MLKLSLIIPVYNEERHICACLDAVAAQTTAPSEVIIVDNNCTDKTLEIAETYNFVRIISQPKQGRGHARSAGFNAASGDILGRIDADSRIADDWVEKVVSLFEADKHLAGVTGIARTDIIPGIHKVKSKIMSRCYYWFAHAGFRTITMWGANMAIRSSEWSKISDEVCLDDNLVHEDQDVSIWIAANGGKITQNNDLLITTNGQTYRYLPKLVHYIHLYHSTRKIHIKNGNLSNEKLIKLSFWDTFPGRIMGMPIAIATAIIGLTLFPVDFIVKHTTKNSSWLD